jgi:hypothetical protein
MPWFKLGFAVVGMGLFTSTVPAFGSVEPKPSCSDRLYAAVVSRSCTSHEKRRHAVDSTWTDRLIRQLEPEHLENVASCNVLGTKSWLQFNPSWVLSSPNRLEELLNYFDPSDGSSPQTTLTFLEWLDLWENGYDAGFGPIAPSWSNGGKKRFQKQVLVEMAVRYAIRHSQGKKPDIFLEEPTETNLSIQPIQSAVGIIFKGNITGFQKAFDRAYRRRVRGRAGPGSDMMSVAERRLLEQIKGKHPAYLGALGRWQPNVRASYRDRTKEMDVQLIADSIAVFGKTSVPLAALFREDTGSSETASQTGVSWAALETLLARHSSPRGLLLAVNQELTERGLDSFQPYPRALTFHTELVVQAALHMAIHQKLDSSFKGFQAEEPTEPFYIEMDNSFIVRSGLTLEKLNTLVMDRLTLP